MSDGTNPDLRWLTERIDRHYAEQSADIAELKTAIAGIPASLERYVLERVYVADEHARQAREQAREERLQRLEEAAKDEQKRRDEDRTANRRMLRSAIVVAVFGVVSTVVSAALVAALVKGSGH